MSERSIETVREYNFDPKEVIKGLNGYYESDKCNSYITIRRNDVEGPAYLSTPIYLSALIEWLREDHDIFYRPGMTLDQVEAARSAAKMCCLRVHIKDEICKRGLWCGADEDVPELVDTLFKGYDGCVKRADKNRKDAVKLSEENGELRKELNDLKDTGIYCSKSYISDRIHEICTAKGVELDDTFLYDDDYTWEDLVGFLCEEIRKLKIESGAKESGIEDLKEHITLLEMDLKKTKAEKEKFLIEVADREEEIESLQNKDYDVYLEHRRYIIKSIMNNIRQEASRNGFELPEEIDGEPLTIERTFHDLLELLMKRTKEIREVNDKRWKDLRDIYKALGRDGVYSNVDDFAKAVKARAECTNRALGEESDINKLIRDYCAKNDIIAPSRYFSDKACIEYLFSVIDLKQKDRAAIILQELYRDIFKKQPDGLSAEDIANKILDKVLETEDLLHKSVDSVNKECKATGKQMVDDYEKDLLQFIYKEYKGRIHLSDETITYNPPSVRNTVLKIISDYARCRTRDDILETRIKSIFDRCKTKFTVDDYVLNGDPTSKFMLDCISSWISSPAESRGKVRAEIENYKLKLKDYILKDIKKHGYRYGGLETKSIEDIVDRIIEIAACSRNEWAKDEIKKLRGQIDSLKSLINAMNEEVKDM